MRTWMIALALASFLGCSKKVETPPPTPTPTPTATATPTPTPTSTTTAGLPAQGQPCADGKCAAGLSCLEYFGIAGPNGPKLTSCEIPCQGGAACPAGQTCITIADGPGQVCRPPTP